MSGQIKHIYEFGEFRMDVAERLLLGKEGPIPLTPKEFDTLLYLVQHSGHLIEKEELMQQVWPDTTVEEGNLARNVWALRRALGDDNSKHRYIETVPKRGYRFVGPVRDQTPESSGLLVQRRIRARIVTEEEEYGEDRSEILSLPAGANALSAGDAVAPLALPAAAQPRSKRRLRAGLLTASLLITAGIGVAAYLKFRKHPTAAAAPRAVRAALSRLTNNTAADEVPRASPNGSRIAFQSNRDGKYEIYLMDADGSNVKRLTNNQADDQDPEWSPDGNKIAFVSDRDGNSEIYEMNSDGSNQRRLTVDAAVDNAPNWSPDSKQLVFASNRGHSYAFDFDIWVMNVDGSGLKRLTTNPEYDSEPRWSPDGSKILFVTGRDENFEIYIMNPDGSDQRNLTRNPEADGGAMWSPDGNNIAFFSGRDGNAEIYVMDRDGENVRRVTDNPAKDGWMSWSADGARLVFQSNRDGNSEIYSMEIDQLTRLTDNLSDDSSPAWSPDGKLIAFTSNRAGKQNIFVMHEDGTQVVQLTSTTSDDTEPSWSPDGTRIAFTSRRDGNHQIYLMNADGSGQTRLIKDQAEALQPAWSPDGKQIAFTRSGDGICVIDANGANLKSLMTKGGSKPSWSPDGKKIVYSNSNPGKARTWFEIFVTDSAGGNVVKLTDDNITSQDPSWSGDGKKIYFVRNTDKQLQKASIFEMDTDGKDLRRLTSVSALDRNARVSPDGSRLAFQSDRAGNNEIYILRLK